MQVKATSAVLLVLLCCFQLGILFATLLFLCMIAEPGQAPFFVPPYVGWATCSAQDGAHTLRMRECQKTHDQGRNEVQTRSSRTSLRLDARHVSQCQPLIVKAKRSGSGPVLM